MIGDRRRAHQTTADDKRDMELFRRDTVQPMSGACSTLQVQISS
jgi:hypothetical protein